MQRGERIGDWIVDEPLGEGGMGTVYRVHSAFSERVTAALKILKPSAEKDARARFVREAEALAALRHPAIVRVLGVTEDRARGLLGLAMELAHGETLRDRIGRGPMPLTEALGIFPPLAAALAHAHQAGVAHRDVKPANVVLCSDGPRLVDFGIATGVDPEQVAASADRGTLPYLPPEVFRNERVDARAADVYALGLILHEALVGQRVFAYDGSPQGAMAAIGARKLAQGELDPGPAAPERLRALVRRATSTDPTTRPSMAEMRDALAQLVERRGPTLGEGERLLSTRPLPRAPQPVVIQATPPADRTTRVPDPPSRTRPPWTAIGLALALLLAAAAALTVFLGRTVKEAVRTVAPSSPATVPTPGAVRPAATMAPVERATPPPLSATAEANLVGAEPPDVNGVWMLENVVDRASRSEFLGLRLGYRLALRQRGIEVEGTGVKVSENGESTARTSIELRGRWQGNRLLLSFTEMGTARSSQGRFVLALAKDGRLTGAFESGAARSSGRSSARRL